MTGRIRRHPFVAGVLGAGLVLGGIWVAKLVQLARSSSTHAAYWSQPQGEAGGLLYVALGDSAAQGIGASDPQHGYVALLAARLRQASGRPVEVVNLSSSGACIGDVLDDQVPALDALSRTPDIVTVAVGGNDVRAYGRATFAAQAEQLAAALPDGAYVADAPYFMHGRWERDAAEAGQLLRHLRCGLVPPQRPWPPGVGRRLLAGDGGGRRRALRSQSLVVVSRSRRQRRYRCRGCSDEQPAHSCAAGTSPSAYPHSGRPDRRAGC